MKDRKYIPVTWGDVGRFFLSLAAAVLAVFNLQSWELLGLGKLSNEQQYSFGQLAICWVLIGEYFLISAYVICLTALLKKGFNNLKPVRKKGLILGLIVGLILGLIGGLIVGLMAGLIGGLMAGLMAGLIVGLMAGLKAEFDGL